MLTETNRKTNLWDSSCLLMPVIKNISGCSFKRWISDCSVDCKVEGSISSDGTWLRWLSENVSNGGGCRSMEGSSTSSKIKELRFDYERNLKNSWGELPSAGVAIFPDSGNLMIIWRLKEAVATNGSPEAPFDGHTIRPTNWRWWSAGASPEAQNVPQPRSSNASGRSVAFIC